MRLHSEPAGAAIGIAGRGHSAIAANTVVGDFKVGDERISADVEVDSSAGPVTAVAAASAAFTDA